SRAELDDVLRPWQHLRGLRLDDHLAGRFIDLGLTIGDHERDRGPDDHGQHDKRPAFADCPPVSSKIDLGAGVVQQLADAQILRRIHVKTPLRKGGKLAQLRGKRHGPSAAYNHARHHMTAPAPRLLVLYHFFHPDQVVSARIFSDFASEQAQRGWNVTALTTNRSLDDQAARYPAADTWKGVRIHRVFRPAWSQKRPVPRLGNSAWTLASWFAHALRLGPFDAVVLGSDPSFAASLAIPLRAAWPRTPIIHWCLCVFTQPGAAEWTGATRLLSPPARAVMSAAYRCCDMVVDLGP